MQQAQFLGNGQGGAGRCATTRGRCCVCGCCCVRGCCCACGCCCTGGGAASGCAGCVRRCGSCGRSRACRPTRGRCGSRGAGQPGRRGRRGRRHDQPDLQGVVARHLHVERAGHAQLDGVLFAAGVGRDGHALLDVVGGDGAVGVLDGNPQGAQTGHHGGGRDADHQPHQWLRKRLDGLCGLLRRQGWGGLGGHGRKADSGKGARRKRNERKNVEGKRTFGRWRRRLKVAGEKGRVLKKW